MRVGWLRTFAETVFGLYLRAIPFFKCTDCEFLNFSYHKVEVDQLLA